MRATLLLSLLPLLACRDPTVGPPSKHLSGTQSATVAAHILKAVPTNLTDPMSVPLGRGRILFLGSRISPLPARRGEHLTITQYFQCESPIAEDWKMFVHIEDSTHPGILFNLDHHPIDNLYPVQRWKTGEIIEDTYGVDLPAGTPDSLTLYIGFYRYNDRLPVEDPAHSDGANRIRAATIPVGGGPELPLYTAPRRTGSIVIDGKLDDPGWQGVPSTGRFVRSLDAGPTKYRTEAWLTWDDENLYVAFDGDDEDVWFGQQKNDAPLYQEEVYEIFIDADGDGKTYNEMEISPGNYIFDAYFPARREGMDLSWDSQMKHAVSVRGTVNNPNDVDQGWSAELQIPVARLASVPHWPPLESDRWRFNLYRLEWHSGRKVNEGSAFSPPMVGDFHNLARFASLQFKK